MFLRKWSKRIYWSKIHFIETILGRDSRVAKSGDGRTIQRWQILKSCNSRQGRPKTCSPESNLDPGEKAPDSFIPVVTTKVSKTNMDTYKERISLQVNQSYSQFETKWKRLFQHIFCPENVCILICSLLLWHIIKWNHPWNFVMNFSKLWIEGV